MIALLLALVVLGWALQEENIMKYNTALKIIDVLLMVMVVVYITKMGIRFYPLAIFLTLRFIYNIAPFFLLWGKDFNYTMEQFQYLYTINRVKPLFVKRGGVFIANHACGSFNDFIASCSLGSKDRLLVVNPGPLGSTIPKDSSQYVCCLDRSGKKSGYDSMKDLMIKHILKNDRSLIVFAENLNLKTSKWKMAPVRSGIVKLCWEMNIPIYGMWIDWPCQFPITFRQDDRCLDVSEWIIHESPGDADSPEELLLSVNNNYEKYINC
jgi:hypothetical protein